METYQVKRVYKSNGVKHVEISFSYIYSGKRTCDVVEGEFLPHVSYRKLVFRSQNWKVCHIV
jgi:hypothetical protein